MHRDILYPALLKYTLITTAVTIALTWLGLHSLLAFSIAYLAVAVYHWLGFGGVIDPPAAWPRFTMAALWPIAYLYATGDDD